MYDSLAMPLFKPPGHIEGYETPHVVCALPKGATDVGTNAGIDMTGALFFEKIRPSLETDVDRAVHHYADASFAPPLRPPFHETRSPATGSRLIILWHFFWGHEADGKNAPK